MSSTEKLYKVKYGCTNCGRTRVTKWKENAKLPHRCHETEDGTGCGKSRTHLSLHKVWERTKNGGKRLIKDKTGESGDRKGDRYW